MKILEVRQALRTGNLERLIVATAARLRQRGYDVDILLLYNRTRARLLGEDPSTLPQDHPLIADAQSQGVAAWQQVDASPFSPQPLLRLVRTLRRGKYDLLHTHDVKSDVLGLVAGTLAGVPVVATAHGYPRAIWRNDVYRVLDLLALHVCRRVICVSFGLRQEMIAAGLNPQRLSVVYNGIDVSAMMAKALNSPHTLRDELHLCKQDKVIMVVGRLSTEKGHIYLLHALRRVAALRPDVRLAIAGAGPLRATLERESAGLGISDRVSFLGFRADVPALLAQCDLVVNPSLGEALGNAVLEAMALGKPVIGTDVGGMPELLGGDGDECVVPAGNSDALASSILRLLGDAVLARRLGERGRDLVTANFTVDKMADGLADVFASYGRRDGQP